MNALSFKGGLSARILAAVALFSLVAGLLPMQAFAAPKADIDICHATGNGGYVKNSPATTADAGGHAGIDHQDGDDIIPPFEIPGGGTFAGQNWDAQGQAIYNNGDCKGTFTPPPTTGTLTVTKVVVNDNGGTKVVANFPLFVNGNSVTSGASNTLAPATYTVTETSDSNYTASFTGDCNSSGSVTLAAGQNKTCTITNNDNVPAPTTGTITIQKTVNNDNGGTAVASNFTFRIDGSVAMLNTPVTVSAGSHTLTEDSFSGYTAGVWGGACAVNGSITVVAGQNYTCTISNNDNAVAPTTGIIVVDKVTNPAASTQSFAFTTTGTGYNGFSLTDTAAANSQVVGSGSYSVSETVPTGWTQTGVSCVSSIGDTELPTALEVDAGETITCTFTNTKEIEVPPVEDVCLNLDGIQTTLPYGYVANDRQCTLTKNSRCEIGENLLTNGSFEEYKALTNGTWGIFTSVLGWTASLTDGIEIWHNLFGFASEGDQNVELDANHPTTITQTVGTIPGATYELRFDFSARPGTGLADNNVDAQADGNLVTNVSADGSLLSSNTWITYSDTFVAGDSSTDISFKDNGSDSESDNSLGSLVDNAVLCLVDENDDDDDDDDDDDGDGGGDNDELSCTLTVDDSSIRRGRDVNVTWDSTNAVSAMLNGETVDLDGTQLFENLRSDTTYTLTIMDKNEQTDNCTVTVDTRSGGGGGGGSNNNNDDEPDGDVLGDSDDADADDEDPEGEVLGDQVSVVPTGAPNAGAGGTSPFTLSFYGIVPVAFTRGARIHG